MKTVLSFSPVRMDENIDLSVKLKSIIINGEVFDFSPIPEGSELPSSAIDSPWFVGNVSLKQGVLYATILLPHGANAPVEGRFPEPITMSKGGVVKLPEYDIVLEEPTFEEAIEEQEEPTEEVVENAN